MSRQISWTRQFGLAFVLLVLGAVAFWLEYKHKPAQEASEEQNKRIFQVKDTPIQSIKIQGNSKSISFICSDFANSLCKPGDNSKWEITEPNRLRADDSNVNAFVSSLNTLNPADTIDLKEESAEKRANLLKDYGLDEESRKTGKKVEVVTAAGEMALYLGANHPIGDSNFGVAEITSKGQKLTGKVSENKVYLIPSFFKGNLDRELTHWRDKKLFTVGVHEIASFKLNGPKAKISAERKDGDWVLHTADGEFAGDVESIDGFLTAATQLSAKDFASDKKDDAQAKKALQGVKPTLTVTLQKEGKKAEVKDATKDAAKDVTQNAGAGKNEPIEITIYTKPITAGKTTTDSAAKAYATVGNLEPLFELDSNAVERLNKSNKEFRLAKLISSMERFSAKKLTFSGTPLGADTLKLVQQEGKWLHDADKSAADNSKMQDFMDKLSGKRIQEFLEGKKIPSGEKEGLKVVLGDEKTPALRELIFWENGGKLYARDLNSKRNEAFQVDTQVKASLPWKSDFFKIVETKADKKADTPKK